MNRPFLVALLAIAAPLLWLANLHAEAAVPLRIILVGDSTVCDYEAKRPDRGWGQFIEERFQPGSVQIINLAAAGRSTRTFIKEGRWQKVLEARPAYVFIQFGHNDSHASDKPESTDAATDYRDNLRRYIEEARTINAIPILVTPMVRRNFFPNGRLDDNLAPYAAAMKLVAAEKRVNVIDLHAASWALIEPKGPDGAQEFASKRGDATHFNEKGARAMADLVIKALAAAEPKLGLLLKTPQAAARSPMTKIIRISESGSLSGFPLVAEGRAAPIVVSPDAPRVIQIVAADLAADIERVTGLRPQVLNTNSTIGLDGPFVRLGVSRQPELAGRWEAFRLSALGATSNSAPVLDIAASDPRGVAYGVYELSRRIGVSPWYWWADVPPVRRDTLRLTTGTEPVDQPAVRYRGIFINDEDWGLEPWARLTFEPAVGNIGPRTYARIFELMLRLRANTLWPGMHPTTTPFHQVPGNAATADAYAIVVGSSHAEPMLRNNVGEWTAPKDDYNYLKNRDGVLTYWEQRVKERTSGESLFTLGMRGIHDSPIVGPKTRRERIATLEKIFTDQRDLLARYLGQGDPTRVGQIFCPYKEVLEDYNAGLRVPEDAIIVWPDDNFGYIRRFATPGERVRSGGLGVYYHASYLGDPLAWLWIDTPPPAFIWSELTRAYEQGARALWIVNVGDIKNTERSAEFFLDLAWHADCTDPDAPARFLRATAARDFGPAHAAAVVDILSRLQALNFARKTEHLQWHLTLRSYKPTELNEAEIHQRLRACADLLRDSDALAERLPATARDAHFELIGYPVAITAAANERYFRSELARADVVRGRSPEANRAAERDADRRIAKLTARYNNDIAGGKWGNIVTVNGVSPNQWKRFQRDATSPRPDPTPDSVCSPAPPEAGPLTRPSGARPGDFVERDKVISIHAGDFTGRSDLPSGAGWHAIPGLGRTGGAVTVLPSTTVITSNAAPSLEYRFHVTTRGAATLRVRLLPTHPLVSGQGLRFAVAVDEGAPIPVAVTSGFDSKSDAWKHRVLANATEASVALPSPLTPGWHTLHLIAVDAGVVVDKLVLDLGGLHPSYDGPPGTRLPPEPENN